MDDGQIEAMIHELKYEIALCNDSDSLLDVLDKIDRNFLNQSSGKYTVRSVVPLVSQIQSKLVKCMISPTGRIDSVRNHKSVLHSPIHNYNRSNIIENHPIFKENTTNNDILTILKELDDKLHGIETKDRLQGDSHNLNNNVSLLDDHEYNTYNHHNIPQYSPYFRTINRPMMKTPVENVTSPSHDTTNYIQNTYSNDTYKNVPTTSHGKPNSSSNSSSHTPPHTPPHTPSLPFRPDFSCRSRTSIRPSNTPNKSTVRSSRSRSRGNRGNKDNKGWVSSREHSQMGSLSKSRTPNENKHRHSGRKLYNTLISPSKQDQSLNGSETREYTDGSKRREGGNNWGFGGSTPPDEDCYNDKEELIHDNNTLLSGDQRVSYRENELAAALERISQLEEAQEALLKDKTRLQEERNAMAQDNAALMEAANTHSERIRERFFPVLREVSELKEAKDSFERTKRALEAKVTNQDHQIVLLQHQLSQHQSKQPSENKPKSGLLLMSLGNNSTTNSNANHLSKLPPINNSALLTDSNLLIDQYTAVLNQNSQLTATLSSTTQELTSLREAHSATVKKLESVEEDYELLVNKHHSLSQAFESTTLKHSQLSDLRKLGEGERGELEERVKSLSLALSNQETTHQKTLENLDEKNVQLVELQTRVATLETEVNTLSENCNTKLEVAARTYQSERLKLLTEIAMLKAHLVDRGSEEVLGINKNRNETEKTNISIVPDQRTTSSDEIFQLKLDLSVLRARQLDDQAIIDSQRDHLTTVTMDLHRLQTERKKLASELGRGALRRAVAKYTSDFYQRQYRSLFVKVYGLDTSSTSTDNKPRPAGVSLDGSGSCFNGCERVVSHWMRESEAVKRELEDKMRAISSIPDVIGVNEDLRDRVQVLEENLVDKTEQIKTLTERLRVFETRKALDMENVRRDMRQALLPFDADTHDVADALLNSQNSTHLSGVSTADSVRRVDAQYQALVSLTRSLIKSMKGDHIQVGSFPKIVVAIYHKDESKVIFADFVTLIDKNNKKHHEKLLILTENALFLFKDKKSRQILVFMQITSLSRVSLSLSLPSLLIIHHKQNHDIMLLADHRTEILYKLLLQHASSQWQLEGSKSLEVEVGDVLTCCDDGVHLRVMDTSQGVIKYNPTQLVAPM